MFASRKATVSGPTPPGTGVILATAAEDAGRDSSSAGEEVEEEEVDEEEEEAMVCVCSRWRCERPRTEQKSTSPT